MLITRFLCKLSNRIDITAFIHIRGKGYPNPVKLDFNLMLCHEPDFTNICLIRINIDSTMLKEKKCKRSTISAVFPWRLIE